MKGSGRKKIYNQHKMSVPERFINYFDDMGKWELIEMLWNRLSEEEREEILNKCENERDSKDDSGDDQ